MQISTRQLEVNANLQTAVTFNHRIKCILERHFSDQWGQVWLLADHDAKVQERLDRQAGIDGWLENANKGGLFGLAIRVQWAKDYRSITIRSKSKGNRMTEFAKLHTGYKAADSRIMPTYHCQFYFADKSNPESDLLSGAIVPTRDVYQYLVDVGTMGRAGREISNGDGSMFLPVDYTELRDAGADITVFGPDAEGNRAKRSA